MRVRSRVVAFGVAAVVVVVGGATVVATSLAKRTPTVALGAPHYVDETKAAGVDHVYDGGDTFSVGGGVAVFDCDGDGRQDMYLAGGSRPAALLRNQSPVGGALRFTPVDDPAAELQDVTGAYPFDLDGDGNVDLAVLRVGQMQLLRGLGACRFQPANAPLAFAAGNGWVTAFAAQWEAGASLPTLAIGRYLGLDRSGIPTSSCATNELVRPATTGSTYAAPLTLEPGYCALSMLFSDWDRSGRRDLRVSNDRHYYDQATGQEQLWRITPGAPPRLYTDADGWVQVQIEGMGIASYDLTGDGYPEVYLTSQAANRLQTLTAGASAPTYRDIGYKRGVNATTPFTGGDVLPSTAWHPEFEDVNNDGFIDLFVSKGNVNTQGEYATKDPSNLLLGQADGTFTEAADAAGILSFDRGRGAALVDFNVDGLLDLVEVNYGQPVRLWRNAGSGTSAAPAALGNWLALRVSEPGPNRDAIGGWLEVRVGDVVERRELTVGGGHGGGQLGWIHFGLGPASDAQVRVTWPDGTAGPWQDVRANQFDIVARDVGVRTWAPPQD